MAAQTNSDSVPSTGVALFNKRIEASSSRVAFRTKVQGTWTTMTWGQFGTAAQEIAGGLLALGAKPGDRLCLLANTRWEWIACDVGGLLAGGVTVPIYQSNTPDQVEYIISNCGATVVVAENPHQLEKLLDPAVRGKLSKVTKVILMSDTATLDRPDAKGRTTVTLDDVLPSDHKDRDWVMSLDKLRETGKSEVGKLAAIEKNITPDDVFTIVYTSGTTGPPKGVVLTHRSIAFEVAAVNQVLLVNENDEQMLFLPLAHIFARILEWSAIDRGYVTAFAESIPKLVANMGEVKPTFMGSVPRVYEKAYAKIQANFEEKRKKPVTRALINWALSVGQRVSKIKQAGGEPTGMLGIQNKLATKLIFSKIQATFGGRLRFFISGGAPLAREMSEFFHAAGILIIEGYGLTETTAATHMNSLTHYRFGTVGPAIPGVEQKIADDGEILVRGPNVLKEYYNNPAATKEVIDADGWFHTGDIGEINDGFLKITDRKKDIIVNANGKNIAPQNLEGALKSRNPMISQVMVHGDKRKFLSALVTVAEDQIVPWATDKGIAFADYSELTQSEQVRALVQDTLDALNATLPSHERVQKIKILEKDFSQEADELTPTLKVKRKFCTEKYKTILDAFYA